MKALFVALFIGVTTLLSAQTVEERSLNEFDEVKVNGQFTVRLIQGESNSLKISAFDASPEDITSEIEGQTLRIKQRKENFKDKKVTIYITYKTLRKIKAFGGAHITAAQGITGDKIEFVADAGGEISAKVSAKTVVAKALKGSEITLQGTTDYIQATANAGGEVLASAIKVKRALVKAATGGIVRVQVIEKLEAKAKAGGEIYYSGHPAKVSENNLGGKIVEM